MSPVPELVQPAAPDSKSLPVPATPTTKTSVSLDRKPSVVSVSALRAGKHSAGQAPSISTSKTASAVRPGGTVQTVAGPEVTVRKTYWHPNPERRVAEVEVEGHKGALELHEGDAVGTLVISEIQPSGVVFLHGGERLQRKVGTGQ